MNLAFQNGRTAADALRPIDGSNPYRKRTKAYFEFRHGYKTAPIYGVKPIARTRREEACSVGCEDAARILNTPPQWGLPTRAVAWFHDANDRLYALCAEWDDPLLRRTRRVEFARLAGGKWRTTISWIDDGEKA